MRQLPSITLDTTLSQLYQQASQDHAAKRIAHIYCGVSSVLDLTPNFPRNSKHVYQDGSFVDPSSEEMDDRARRALSIRMLSLVTQRDAFISGNTPVIFFHTDHSDEKMTHDHDQQSRTLEVLFPDQKPEIVFYQSPSDIHFLHHQHDIDHITCEFILDATAEATDNPPSRGLTSLIDIDKLWYLNSNESLATSNLPTPKTEIIELEEYDDGGKFCTPGVEDTLSAFDFDARRPSGYHEWMHQQISTIIVPIRRRKLPCVVKANQSFGGAATWTLDTEDDREDLIDTLLTRGVLRRWLSLITASNEHLNIGTILIHDQIPPAPGRRDINLTFFLNADGTAIFLAACEKSIDRSPSSSARRGSRCSRNCSNSSSSSQILYSQQPAWQEKLSPLMHRIAAHVHEHEYFGPVAAQIRETRSGELLIVDLNVRTTGSLCLPLVRTHFTRNGLDAAATVSTVGKESREEFIDLWREEFGEGRLVIRAWYDEPDLGRSFGDVVVGAEDEMRLGEMIERIRGMSEREVEC